MGLFSKKHKELEPSSQAMPDIGKDELESLAPEIPMPPTDMKIDSSGMPQPPGQQPPQQQNMQGANLADDKKEFELPDFDDSEIVKEEPVVAKKEPEKKPEPPKAPPPKPAPPPTPPQPVEELQHRFLEQKETFLYVLDYLNAREGAEEIGRLLSDTSQSISRHAVESKGKDDKYASLIKELNMLQERLMDIDTKLFEEV